jgi:hypothetical protein
LEENMICHYCAEEGEKSVLYPSQGGATTLLGCPPYYDEDGEYHHHDSNATSNAHQCSRGHYFVRVTYDSCPAKTCSWSGGETTFKKLEPPAPFKLQDGAATTTKETLE